MKKEAVFVYKVNVGSKSPEKAKEYIQELMNSSITLSETEVKNIFIPASGDSTVECIYPVPGMPVMEQENVMKFSRVREVKSPTRGTSKSAGIDFYVPGDFTSGGEYFIKPGENVLIPSGIKAKVPTGYALIAFNKSGVATKKGLYVGACVVDEDYQGEIHLHLTNVGDKTAAIQKDDKIAQFILLPVYYATPVEVPIQELYDSTTERGVGGFGSTDDKKL